MQSRVHLFFIMESAIHFMLNSIGGKVCDFGKEFSPSEKDFLIEADQMTR